MKLKLYILLLAILTFSCTSAYRFTEAQKSMILDGDKSAPMRVYKINKTSDSLLLRTESKKIKVDSNDELLKTFVDRLYATVRDSMSLGVGIAAPQVGILKDIIWVQRFDKESFPFEIYFNPKIIKYSKETQPCPEGCLSIPDRMDTTYVRAETILIEYDSYDQKKIREEVSGFTAVVFQHEIDHLNGILYLDHLKEEENELGSREQNEL